MNSKMTPNSQLSITEPKKAKITMNQQTTRTGADEQK